jgi:RHS repeat-associated protein
MGDTPIATLQPNGSSVAIYYVHTDHLGTPRKITRPSDNGLMWRWDPDTFGSVAPNSNPAGLGTFTYNLRFPGQYSLNESGIFYNYFRDYDPSMGRYIESDPIGLQGGINTYAYTSGNPISRIDPPGLDDSICMFNWRMCGPEQMTPVQVLPNTSVSVNLPTPYRLGRVPIIVALKYKSTPSGSSCSIGVGPGNIGANFVPRIGDSVSQTSFGDTSGWGLTSSATLKVPGLPVGYSFSQTNFANGALSISQGPQTVGGQTTISFTYGYTWKW